MKIELLLRENINKTLEIIIINIIDFKYRQIFGNEK